jgi:hypothetical protein
MITFNERTVVVRILSLHGRCRVLIRVVFRLRHVASTDSSSSLPSPSWSVVGWNLACPIGQANAKRVFSRFRRFADFSATMPYY